MTDPVLNQLYNLKNLILHIQQNVIPCIKEACHNGGRSFFSIKNRKTVNVEWHQHIALSVWSHKSNILITSSFEAICLDVKQWALCIKIPTFLLPFWLHAEEWVIDLYLDSTINALNCGCKSIQRIQCHPGGNMTLYLHELQQCWCGWTFFLDHL